MMFVVVGGISDMCPCPVVCLRAVYWGVIVSLVVLVTIFGYFSLPCRFFLSFLRMSSLKDR